MAVLYRAAAGAKADYDTLLSCPKPAGLVTGDLLVAILVADRDGDESSLPSPAGWTLAGGRYDLGTVGDTRVWWRIAGGSEPAEYDFGTNRQSDSTLAIIAYQAGSFDTTSPIADLAFGGSATSGNTHTAPSVAGLAGGALVCAFMAGDNVSTTRTWSGYTSGLTELIEVDSSDASWTSMAVAHQLNLTTGATGTKTATCTDSTRWLTASIVIRQYAVTAHSRTPADLAAATDAAQAGFARARAGADAAAATDAVTAFPVTGRLAGDVAGTGDASSRQTNMVRPPKDAAPVLDHAAFTFTRSDITDYQFVIAEGPEDTSRPWVPFGLGQTIVVENFDPGMAEARAQDTLSPVADVRWFGTDLKTPPTWAFDLYTDIDFDPAFPERAAQEALAWAQVMDDLWDAEELRRTPNAVLPLRYRVGGRTRRVHGRPRNFAVIPNFIRTGRISMVADFALAENVYYEDSLSQVTVRTVPSNAAANGVVFPITFPMTIGSQGDSPRVETALVGGKRPTWVDVTFRGPAVDPWVVIGGTRWQLRGTVAEGTQHAVTMTGKPWAQGVRRADGTWLAGMLDPSARLSQLRLPPGQYPVTYGAYDPTGTSYATVAWRNAYGTM